MKKIFILFALLFSALTYGQIATFNVANIVEITTAQRDGLTIGANQFPIIYNVTTGQHEKYNGASWEVISGAEVNNLTSSVTWANVPDANITEGSVTQHQAALSVTESQISDLSHTTDTNLTQEEAEDFAGGLVSGVGDGLEYNDVAGSMSVAEAELTITESQISDLSHTANTDAQDLTLTGNTLAVTGDPNTDVDISTATAVAANTAKTSNAVHTGDVTGGTALTIAVDAVDIPMLSATGTADATTVLHGNNTWAVPTTSADDQDLTLTGDIIAIEDDPTADVDVSTATSVAANTAKVSADGSFATHSDLTKGVAGTHSSGTLRVIADHDVDGTYDVYDWTPPTSLPTISQDIILGRISAGNGATEQLTATQARTILNVEDNSAADQSAAEVVNTPSGNLIATDVQGALNELQTELDGVGGAESTTVSDTGEIDLTLSTFDITADIVASSIDETKLDASTNASLDLADSSVQDATTDTFTNKTISDFSNFVEADNIHVSVRNESGGTINRGDAVYISGYSVGQDRPLVALADSDGTGTMPAFGLVEDASIANNANGSILIVGRLDNVDTSSFALDDFLYVSATGTTGNTLTATRSTTPGVEVQKAGIVLRDHATLGVIEIFGAGRSNDIPNSMADDVFKVHGSVDDTKLVRIEADSLTTATTRTIHMRDADVDLNALTTDNIAPSTIKPLDLNVDNALTDEWFFAYETTTGNFKMVAGSTPSDIAYSESTWNANTDAASKNAIRDEMEQRVPSKLAGEPTGSDLVTNIVSLTQSEYDAGSPVAGTVYIVTDAKTTFREAVAISDNTTALTTGVKWTWYSPPYAITITDIEASLLTAATGAEFIADIHDDGVTIMGTHKLDIEVSEFHTKDKVQQPVISAGSIAASSKLEAEIDQVGSTIAGAGAVIYIYYTID